MAISANDGKRRGTPWRTAIWGGAAALLLLPLVAMQFTREVNWTLSDFVFMGVLLGGAGLALELALRTSNNIAYRAGAAVAIAACFLLVVVNAAVGILGGEGNPANLMYLGVIAIALIGAVRFRDPAGMARAMLAAAAAQLAVGVIALAAGWTSPGATGVYEVTIGTALFVPLWLLSAGLFRRAAGGASAEGRPPASPR